jgi:hypothetical protein
VQRNPYSLFGQTLFKRVIPFKKVKLSDHFSCNNGCMVLEDSCDICLTGEIFFWGGAESVCVS